MKNPETPEEKEAAIAAYRNLLNTEGWKLIEQIQDENIQEVQRQLEEGLGEGETKKDIDVLREKLRLMRELRDTPLNMIKKLESPDTEPDNPDPFDTVEEIEVKTGETVIEVDSEE